MTTFTKKTIATSVLMILLVILFWLTAPSVIVFMALGIIFLLLLFVYSKNEVEVERTKAAQERQWYLELDAINKVLISLREGSKHNELVTFVPKFIDDFLKAEYPLDRTKPTFINNLPLLDAVKLVKALVENQIDITALETSRDFLKKFKDKPGLADEKDFIKLLRPETIRLAKKIFIKIKKIVIAKLDKERDGIIAELEQMKPFDFNNSSNEPIQ